LVLHIPNSRDLFPVLQQQRLIFGVWWGSVCAELKNDAEVKVTAFHFPGIGRDFKPWFVLAERIDKFPGWIS
jgi:hypothetical protein